MVPAQIYAQIYVEELPDWSLFALLFGIAVYLAIRYLLLGPDDQDRR